MQNAVFTIRGLTDQQVLEARNKYGYNHLETQKKSGLIRALKSLIKEPMVVLLLVASSVYLLSGNPGDALFLASAIVLVSVISLYQDSRSRNALEKLQAFTQPTCKVIRNGNVEAIKSDDLVPGDSLMVEEGDAIAADGIIIHSNDFSVNESLLTGESLTVYKQAAQAEPFIYSGTTVTSGLAIATVTDIGNETKLGKIGKSLENITEEKTPLEVQINHFVKKMVMIGAVVFLIVWTINYVRSSNALDSLLKALTLAMSILPEEIPVAFATFMALGAQRLMKKGIVVKQMKTVETLGSATVICTDKTGTLTENKMSLVQLYVHASQKITPVEHRVFNDDEKDLIRLAMWASEPIAFDPMETALHEAYEKTTDMDERPLYKMIHEYPLDGRPPMMTHVFSNASGKGIIAAKGAPEALAAVSHLTTDEKKHLGKIVEALSVKGYRILGVGEAVFTGNAFPTTQQEFSFRFRGLVAFYDPPKKNIASVLKAFYKAGVAVKIVTGDNAGTTTAIAEQIGLLGYNNHITGDELMALSEMELRQKVLTTQVFTRMFPEAKLRIINALKAQNEIVAMTGDGVNDAPALKAAHIGIAMGKKGSEIAKQAASLILLEDNLSKMVDAIAMGRRIYTNLKKAIQYIISIHIPIILTVFIPLALGWIYPTLFSPVHVIFLELIMGPTCSIIYENEPLEKHLMHQSPRPFTATFLGRNELVTSIFQGSIITVGTLFTYQYAVRQGFDISVTRTMVFTVLIAANVFLTLVNRSFYHSFITTLHYKNRSIPLIIGISIILSGLLIYVQPLARFFEFIPLSLPQLSISIGIGALSVIWYELIKWYKRISLNNLSAFSFKTFQR